MELYSKITKTIILIICITPLVIIPFVFDYFYFPKIFFIYIALTFISIIWFLCRDKSDISSSELSNNDKLIGIYLILIIISTIFSPDIKSSLWGKRLREEGLFAISAYILLYLFSKRYFQISKKQLRFFQISVSIVALYGIIQYFGFDPIPRDFIRYHWRGRAFSTIGNPNYLGAYLVLVLPIFMFIYVYSKKTIVLFITLLTYLCLLCTNSRGAWLGFLISLVALIYYVYKLQYSRKCLFITLGFMVAITILFNLYNDSALSSRFLTIFDDVNKVIAQTPDVERAGSSRIFIWTRVIELIKENPIWGVGLETLDLALHEKFESDIIGFFGGSAILDKAHNEYLHIAVTTGIPSLIAYLAFLVSIVWKAFKQIKNNYLVLPLFCSILGYLAQAFFNISVVSVAPIFWIFLGILYKLADDTEKQYINNTSGSNYP
jgi:O-antigen ligase